MKKSNNDPCTNVHVENLVKESARNHDLSNIDIETTLTLQHLNQLQDENDSIINNNRLDKSGSDSQSMQISNDDKNTQDESMMVDNDDDIKEHNSTTSNEFVNDDFDALNKAINGKRNEPSYQHIDEDKSIKGLTIEIDFQVYRNVEHCVTSITHFTMDLIKKRIQSKAIDRVWALDGKSLLKSEFEDVEA